MPFFIDPFTLPAERFGNISTSRHFTDQKLQELRDAIAQFRQADDILIGANGSYARREASEQSDLDFFVICRTADESDAAREVLNQVAPILLNLAGRPPATGGAFGDVEDLQTMLSKIGGNDDHNSKITRRVLFLLEGEWLNNNAFFDKARDELIGRYVRGSISSHQIALFLLNDFIRYYRTVCVDFEFKTIQEEPRKPWGTRNIKLVFSRKLLYFSGILAVAETAQCTYTEKIRVLTKLLNLPVIDRILAVCGARAIPALEFYDRFLGEISNPEVRSNLDKVTEDTRDTEPFRRLKDMGHHFSWRLMSLLRETYDPSHPIHRALFL